MNKTRALQVAAEVAKESARAGHEQPEVVIERVYNKLNELSKRGD